MSYQLQVLDASLPAARGAAATLERTEATLLTKRDELRLLELQSYRQVLGASLFPCAAALSS